MCWHHRALSLLIVICFATASHAEEANADSAEQFIKSWAATFNKNSSEKLLAFYDRSKETEVIISAGTRIEGYKAVEKMYTDDLKNVRFYDSSAQKMKTRMLGETAIVTFEHRFKGHILADQSRAQIHVRTTSVIHRIDNQWKIVHEHSSPIRGVERVTRIEE